MLNYNSQNIPGGAGGGAVPLIFNQQKISVSTSDINNQIYPSLPGIPISLNLSWNNTQANTFPVLGWGVLYTNTPGDIQYFTNLVASGGSSQSLYVTLGNPGANTYTTLGLNAFQLYWSGIPSQFSTTLEIIVTFYIFVV